MRPCLYSCSHDHCCCCWVAFAAAAASSVAEFYYADPDLQHWLLGSWVAIAATVAVTVAPIIIAAAAGLLLLLRSLAVLWNFIMRIWIRNTGC